jgi:hypothetical protein
MSTSQEPQSVIEIKTSYFFLAFILALFKPQASINGTAPFPLSWGSTPVPVPPGRYQVEVWVPYLFLSTMGKNGAIVDVPSGGAVQVAWRAPFVVFMQGKVTVSGPQPLGAGQSRAQAPPQAQPVAAAAGGWHADPGGRHEQRYYDGTAWTDHVVDRGVQSTDPLGR